MKRVISASELLELGATTLISREGIGYVQYHYVAKFLFRSDRDGIIIDAVEFTFSEIKPFDPESDEKKVT